MSVLWYFNSNYQTPFFVTLVFTITSGVDALSFLLGPILDRLRVRSLLMYATLFQIVISVLLVMSMLVHINKSVIGILLIVFLLFSTICSAMIYPTENKLLPVLATGKQLLHVNGLFQMSYQILDLILNGMVAGILSYLSIRSTLAIAVPVFGIAFLVFKMLAIGRTLIPVADNNIHYLHLLKVGWITLLNHPFMVKTLIPFAVLNFFYGAADTALPRLAKVFLSNQAWGYGAILTGNAIAGLLGALAVQKLTFTGKKLIKFAGFCMLIGGLCRMMILINQAPILLVLAISLNSFWNSMMNINFIAFVQSEFSPDVLGRVSTINESLISTMIPFGSVLGGFLVAILGSVWPQIIYGATTVICGLYFLKFLFKRV